MSCKNLYESLSVELVLHAKNKQTLKQLLLNGADINYQAKNGWCLLFELITLNQSQTLSKLRNYPLNLYIKDHKNRSALFWTIYHGHNDILHTLITMGYAVNEEIGKDPYALHYLIYKNNSTILQTLLESGLKTNTKDPYHNTVLDYAYLYQHKEMIHTLYQHHT